MAGPHLPAGSVLRGTRDPVGRRTRRGHRRVQAPPLRRAPGRPRAGPPVNRPPVNTGRPDLGRVTVLGAHILDVLGRPVETIPPGQGSVRLEQIRATAAGTAAGTGVRSEEHTSELQS